MAIRRAAGTMWLLLACGVVLAPSQRPQLNIEAFRTKIRKTLADGAAPSLAVAVARNGEIVWSEAFGFADREARVPATAETPYSIASLTKPFTATALMILEERRRLGLDEPLSRYLGTLERPGVSAPVRDCSTERSLVGAWPRNSAARQDPRRANTSWTCDWSGLASRGRSRGGPVWDRAPTWR